MLNPIVNQMLDKVKEALQVGTLTPGKHIMEGTLVCFAEQAPNGGVIYHQMPFEALSPDWQLILRNRTRGERLGPYKVVGVFDYWAPECPAYIPATKAIEA